MNIPKAIEILQMDINDPGSVAIEDVNQAEALGIEALKDKVSYRKRYPRSPISLLPGETED